MCIVKSKDISPEIRPWNILWKHLKPIKHTVKRQCRVSASLLAYFVKAACNVFCPPSWIWYNEEVLRWPQVFRLQQPFRAQVAQAHHKLRGIARYVGTWNAAADRWNEEKKAKIGQKRFHLSCKSKYQCHAMRFRPFHGELSFFYKH